jgi:hypothetical protein
MEDYDARVTPYMIDESEFAAVHTLEEKAKFLLRYAVLAPSGHNAQPWQFGLTGDGVLVYADYSRRLPVANPDDRELIMSVATSNRRGPLRPRLRRALSPPAGQERPAGFGQAL